MYKPDIMSDKKHRYGFTLIELLVVISIIAVLMSIMMPALSRARHQAKLVTCSNNLHQMGIGLNAYATENKNKYFTRVVQVPRIIYDSDTATVPRKPDVRDHLVDYIGSKMEGAFFCPAIKTKGDIGQLPGVEASVDRYISDEERAKWAKHFWLAGGSYGGKPIAYIIGYNLYAGLTGTGVHSYKWNESGNSTTVSEPKIAGSSKDVIASDVQESWPNAWGTKENPYRSNHSAQWQDVNLKFESSNALYGDGHIEKHTEIKYGVTRQSGGYFGY